VTLRLLLVAFAAANAFGAATPDFRNLPISFEPNRGQFAAGAQFGARAGGLLAGVSGHGIQFQLGGEPVTMTWKGGRTSTKARGVDLLPGKANYLLGSDRELWKTNIPTYRKIVVPEIYKEIDLAVYGTNSQLEYDLMLAPGANANSIVLQFKGVHQISVSKQGDLWLRNGSASLMQHRPRAYQVIHHHKTPIEAKYVLRGTFEVGFELAGYDCRQPVIIDPELSFSSVFGGGGSDVVQGMAVDQAAIFILWARPRRRISRRPAPTKTRTATATITSSSLSSTRPDRRYCSLRTLAEAARNPAAPSQSMPAARCISRDQRRRRITL
jgi:hypothetical protein